MSAEAEKSRSASGLKTRALSGLVLAPIVMGIIIAGGWPFLLLIGAAATIALYEFIALVMKISHRGTLLAGGTVYLLMCFGSYIFIRFGFAQGGWLALSIVLAVWASDIGAYFSGKTIGGPKMAPRLSPNKTWAGLGGAMFFCGLTLALLLYAGKFLDAYIMADIGLKPLEAFYVFLGGLLLGAVGQAGDLLISFFKRRAGAKDTGHLIPGHGGLLDRIDSLLLVSPAFLLMLSLCL